MRLYTVETGNFKLDGGAMFGVVPKSIWNRTNPADSNNMIDIAARSLLIEEGDRLILIDTGLGNKQSDKFFSYYHLWEPHHLDGSLEKLGFHQDDITDVFMTHLHFDHCGGSVQLTEKGLYTPAFKNATYRTNQPHWEWATKSTAREYASFLKENILPLEQRGQLKFIATVKTDYLQHPPVGFATRLVHGHTDQQIISHIIYSVKTIVFAA